MATVKGDSSSDAEKFQTVGLATAKDLYPIVVFSITFIHYLAACVSEDFLKREWLDREGKTLRGARHNEHIQALLK